MKLYWSTRSPYARKVMVFAHETGLTGRIETIGTRAVMTAPNRDLMRINPVGKIPTLVTDDGMVLFDSSVICEYLDSLHGGEKLFPTDPARRWQALRWHALGNNLLDNLVPWRNERLRPVEQQSPEMVAAYGLKVQNGVDFLDREAAALTATPVSIGHTTLAVALGYLDFRFPELEWRKGRGKIAAWYEAFAQRPSIRNTMPIDA